MLPLMKRAIPCLMGLCLVPAGLSAQTKPYQHPLDGLTTDEYWTVHNVLTKAGHLNDDNMVSSLLLHEPEKAKVLAWKPGDPVTREADVVLLEGGKTFEARVDIKAQTMEFHKEIPGKQGPVTMGEMGAFDAIAKKDPRVLKALHAHGITDLSSVHCGAGPLSFIVFPEQADHRIGWGACTDSRGAYHSWGRTVEGIYIMADMTTKKIMNVIDRGSVPMPDGFIDFEESDDMPRTGTKPIVNTQPAGPSYTLQNGEVSWQNWSFRFRLDPRVGPVVNMVKYQDGEKSRSVMYEGSLSEMYVPYMDPEEGWNSRAFLDAGEFLLGGLIKPLGPDDCPANARYFRGYAPSDKGAPVLKQQLACLYEHTIDNPAWRHYENNMINGRPSRELVLRTAAVVGNYDYLMDWIFEQDGTIRVAVGATGIVESKTVKQTKLDPMDMEHMHEGGSRYGTLVAPNVVAVNHDHYFSYRLDLDVDGTNNSFMVDRLLPEAVTARTRKSIWAVHSSLVKTEKDGILDLDSRKPSMWMFVNPSVHGQVGHPTGYEIMPGMTAVSNVSPEDPAQKVGAFSQHQMWVTPYNPDELYAAGMYVTGSKGEEGLPAWTKADRSLVNTDIVAWYTLGFHHVVRLEDWPVMPTMWHDFLIRPMNFFDNNPVMTLPHQP